MDNKWNELLDKWKDLTSKGNVQESSEFYYEYMFDQVIKFFTNKFSTSRQSETLISLLGFSPEPIILTARALNPESHYILTTKNIEDTDLIDRYLHGNSIRIPNDLVARGAWRTSGAQRLEIIDQIVGTHEVPVPPPLCTHRVDPAVEECEQHSGPVGERVQ